MLRAALASGHPWLDGITYERLWEEGYARLNRPEGWMPFANGGFATRSGKAELYSEAQREAGLDPLPSAGDIPSGDGLQLITGKQLHYLNSGYNNMERHRRRAGELFIELHAEDARRRGVAEGDAVAVRNGFGEVRAVCRISDRVRPGIAWMPFGGSLDADGQRRSVNALTPEEPTDWGGGSGLYDAFVEVVPTREEGAGDLQICREARRMQRSSWLFVSFANDFPCLAGIRFVEAFTSALVARRCDCPTSAHASRGVGRRPPAPCSSDLASLCPSRETSRARPRRGAG